MAQTVKCGRCGFKATIVGSVVSFDPIAMQTVCAVAKERQYQDSIALSADSFECSELDAAILAASQPSGR